NVVGAAGICASLDAAGAPITVEECTANAGTITADFSNVSLVNGSATLTATPDGNINVPAGYSVLYVLTSGSGLVIEQVAGTPSFTVADTGLFTIHTLVYNGDSTSSDFLDLSIVQFGTTTGFDVLNVVGAAGICASLDAAGAPITVDDCSSNAGTLTAVNSTVTIVNGSASLAATPDGNIVVPNGYAVLYVLTSGSNLVIQQVDTVPNFSVSSPGLYTIHTLVFNPDTSSTNFLNLGVVVPGTTTGGDVLNIITTNGICASLDVAGAPINVMNMLLQNLRAVGGVVENRLSWTISGGEEGATMFIERSSDGVIFTDMGQIELQKNYVQKEDFDFVDRRTPLRDAIYRIKYVSLSGSIGYSKLAKVELEAEPRVIAFPNPVMNQLRLKKGMDDLMRYQLVDLNGRVQLSGKLDFTDKSELELDLGKLTPGMYQLLLISNGDNHKEVIKVMKR
ncbi:MAG: hypothetical protein MRZ79_03860, partial [Bacteroidia bacterium]|nr:hypothetical protein [Bacteroidia bacterium]